MINVTHVEGSLTPAQKAGLAERLTGVLLEIEGGPAVDGPRARSISWVLFHELKEDAWAIGGKFDDTYVSPPGKFHIRVQVPEGSLSRERKAKVHRSVDEAIYDVLGLGVPPAPEARFPSIFVMIHEWDEGNAGALGQTWGLASIGAYVGAGDPAIRERSKAYLTARAKSRQAAGYPD